MKRKKRNRPRRQSPRAGTRRQRRAPRRRKLLKTACAGLLGMSLGDGAAHAFEVNEATSPLVTGGDFDDAFPGENLGAGVTSIVGYNSTGSPGPEDFFQLTGLTPGNQFAITLGDSTSSYSLLLFNSAGVRLPMVDLSSSPGDSIVHNFGDGDFAHGMGTVGTTIPADGILVGNVTPVEGGGTYALAIVPEPAAGAIAGLGAAALLGAARRKQQ